MYEPGRVKKHKHIVVCKVLYADDTKLFGRDIKGALLAVIHIIWAYS